MTFISLSDQIIELSGDGKQISRVDGTNFSDLQIFKG